MQEISIAIDQARLVLAEAGVRLVAAAVAEAGRDRLVLDGDDAVVLQHALVAKPNPGKRMALGVI